MDSTFPVLLPEDLMLFQPHDHFESHVKKLLDQSKLAKGMSSNTDRFADFDVGSPPPETKFMEALDKAKPTPKRPDNPAHFQAENKMFTENLGVAHRSTGSPLLDLFTELEKTIDGERLEQLLKSAWKEDALATLKIVWNARSIHLGKGEMESFYKCLGWIKQGHPLTLLSNLHWLYRSVIEKKVKAEEDEDMEVVEEADTSDSPDIPHGGSHGYWKDLLNILVLAANDSLEVRAEVDGVLHKQNEQPVRPTRRKRTKASQKGADSTASKKPLPDLKDLARQRRHELQNSRYENVLKKLNDPFYHSLHLYVARLFAEQLRKDKMLRESDNVKDHANISLAAKWAPSLEGFHDKHTLIATSIAEILYPQGEGQEPRELHLKRARELYRSEILSPLRHTLAIVERDITAETFAKIDYGKVPSVAMNNYKNLFIRKDLDRFEKYIEKVATGKAKISGAVLMPATLVNQARVGQISYVGYKDDVRILLQSKIAQIQLKALDGQWATLVKRVRDNGKLSSSIAVCDVSGSMSGPIFRDKTCPMDSSIGLSLLLAELTEKPFGGRFITFSGQPEVVKVGGPDDTRSFAEKVKVIQNSTWSMNTDFVAVFERLILPMAVSNNLKPEDMVKQVFVFSDMQFDAAQDTYASNPEKWETAFERIKRKFDTAGYEMPRLIFWNLAGGRAGHTGSGDPVAPKPVTKDEENVMMVSGYSQGMMKMFLENGQFEDEGEELEEVTVDEDGDVETKTAKKQPDPMAGLWKAIGHKAYDMLRVVD